MLYIDEFFLFFPGKDARVDYIFKRRQPSGGGLTNKMPVIFLKRCVRGYSQPTAAYTNMNVIHQPTASHGTHAHHIIRYIYGRRGVDGVGLWYIYGVVY